MLAELELLLREHTIEAWFPKSLDLEFGGFFCDFDRKWRRIGAQDKLIEFQARQTLFAAEALAVYPKDDKLLQAINHGLTYLKNTMWDSEHGGWYHRLDRRGIPLEAGTKHAHGAAYGILACTAVFETTRAVEALELAQQGFHWLERCSYDSRFGGYLGFQKMDGTAIQEKSRSPLNSRCDPIIDAIDVAAEEYKLKNLLESGR